MELGLAAVKRSDAQLKNAIIRCTCAAARGHVKALIYPQTPRAFRTFNRQCHDGRVALYGELRAFILKHFPQKTIGYLIH